ncbi:hypothetical protein ACFLV7_04140 [Chloroflexota bacterium]
MNEHSMNDQTLTAIAAVLVEIRDLLAAISSSLQAQTPSDTIRIIQAESITKGVDDNGKTSYKVRGYPFNTYGVRIWPEALPRIGVKEVDLENGPNNFTKPVQVLMVQGKPKKVIGLASASSREQACANGEPYYEPPRALAQENEIPF